MTHRLDETTHTYLWGLFSNTTRTIGAHDNTDGVYRKQTGTHTENSIDILEGTRFHFELPKFYTNFRPLKN